jgi:hypothetical protein
MDDLTGFELWKQGAEGKVYRGELFGQPAVVKERFTKMYRHPSLDQHLTQERFRSEAKMLVRCKATGKEYGAFVLKKKHNSQGACFMIAGIIWRFIRHFPSGGFKIYFYLIFFPIFSQNF